MFELLHIVWTGLLLAIFVAICLWAWNKGQQRRFERAAHAILADDGEGAPAAQQSRNRHHG